MAKDKFNNTVVQKKHFSSADVGLMILLLVTVFPLTYKIISPIMILAGLGAYTKSITGTLYIIGIILALSHIRSRVSLIDIVMCFAFAIFFILSPAIYPISSTFVSQKAHDILLYFVPFFFLGLMVNYKRDRRLIQIVMRMAFLIAVFWEFCLLLGLVELSSDSGVIGEQMEFAYALLVVVSSLFVEYNVSHQKFDLIAFIIGSLLIVFAGTRGPLVLWVLFIASYYFFFYRFKHNNNLKKTFIALAFLLFYFFSTPILVFMSNLASSLGFTAKAFEELIKGNMYSLQESSGRDLIYDAMWNAIRSDHAGFGYGFGSDRFFSPSNGYAHNFELEILVQFGYVGGTLIFIVLLLFFITSLKKSRGTFTEGFWLVILFWGVMALQFSKSYLMHPGFFFMIGYYVSILRTKVDDIKDN